jgi:Tfp pilus assembly protein PilF
MLQRFFPGVLLFFFAIAFFAIAACAAVRAQAPPTTEIATQEQLTVRVVFEDETPVPADIRVQLLSLYGSGVDSGATDTSGTVHFTGLTPSTYKVRISGFGIDTTESGAIELTDSGPNVTQFFHVRRTISATEASSLGPIDATIPPQARKEFDKATEKMDQKNWIEAKTHLDRAIAIYPKYALAHNNLGLVYVNLKDGEKAVESFRTAAQLNETLQQANLYLGQFYCDNKDFKRAEPYLLHAADAEPRNPQILTALANAEMRNGESEQALANAQKVHSLPDHKKFAIAHLIAAQVLSDRGENRRAQEEYRRFLQEDPDSPLAGRVKDALSKLDTASK